MEPTQTVRRIVICALAALICLGATASAADAYVYWVNRGGGTGSTVGRANLDGTGANQSFISGATGPVGVAVDGGFIYWANTFGLGAFVGRAKLDGTSANQGFINGAHGPCGVAVDGSHIYWANGNTNAIGRANLDGTGVDQSFITVAGISNPCGVAVDGSHVYWANEGGTTAGTTIGRANLDGSIPTNNFITGASAPVGLAVNGSFIYWGNNNSNTIGRANLNGTSPNNNFITGAGGCTDFPAVDATYIYWANDCASSIARANLDGTGINENFISVAFNPGGVAVDQLAPLAVSLAGSGAGSVSGAGISCPSNCSSSYSLGQQVTLAATPGTGSTFAGWSGAGCSGTGACTVTIGAEQAVTATFGTVPPVPKPSCTLRSQSSKVLLPTAKKRHKARTKGTPGTLTFKVSCDQATKIALTSKLTEVLAKKHKHAKQRVKTFKLRTSRSVQSGIAVNVAIKLPAAALTALAHGARESLAVTLTATNTNGSSQVRARIARLRTRR